jgi:hypothetical protein
MNCMVSKWIATMCVVPHKHQAICVTPLLHFDFLFSLANCIFPIASFCLASLFAFALPFFRSCFGLHGSTRTGNTSSLPYSMNVIYLNTSIYSDPYIEGAQRLSSSLESNGKLNEPPPYSVTGTIDD